VIAGALDGATAAPLARELALAIPGGKFMEIPGCGHCPQLEKPQLFVDTVDAFLARA
jgi:pimeloyl-ACP methyl ester carboxylesterase